MTHRTDSVVSTIIASQKLSASAWKMAADTADNKTAKAEYERDAARCDGDYIEALKDIEDGYYEDASFSLEAARVLEKCGGDDQHATRALEALKSLLSESTAT